MSYATRIEHTFKTPHEVYKFTVYLHIYHFFCTSWTICAQIVTRRESVAVPGRKDERITHKKMACDQPRLWLQIWGTKLISYI